MSVVRHIVLTLPVLACTFERANRSHVWAEPCPRTPLCCDVRRTEGTADLLTELHRGEPGFAPYLLTAWSPVLAAWDTVTLPDLARLLDEPLALRKPRTGHTASRQLTWHFAIRNTTSVELNDDHWFELTREVVDVTGIERDDDPAACRWAALRNTADGLDIVATVIRADGHWARLHNDAYFARSACWNFAHDHGLDGPPPITGMYHSSPAGPNRGISGSSS